MRCSSHRTRRIAGALMLVVATAVSTVAAAAPPRTARGTTGFIDVASAEPLRAKPVLDASAAVLVRVNPIADGLYRIEYIGVLEGPFDLAGSIERADGRAIAAVGGLPDLRVEIYSQLPPNHGTDVFGLHAPSFSLAAHYRTMVGVIVALWIAVPLTILVRRLLRRKPAPIETAPVLEPTVTARLFAIVDEARTRELDIAERGRLELLLLRALRSDRPERDLPSALAALRGDAQTSAVVRAVEAWLHAPTAGDRSTALAQIDALRTLEGATR